jgi:hypothetical protein
LETINNSPWWENKQFKCPCCQATLEIRLSVTLDQVSTKEGNSEFECALNSQEPIFTADEQKVLKYAKANGIYAGFVEVVKILKSDSLPGNIEKFFLTVLATMKPRLLPKFALNRFIEDFPGTIDFYASQGIGIVVSSGEIKRFVPTELMGSAKIKGIGVGTKKRISVAPEELDGFLKTKYGLVAHRGAMFSMMGGKSLGNFCHPKAKEWRDL